MLFLQEVAATFCDFFQHSALAESDLFGFRGFGLGSAFCFIPPSSTNPKACHKTDVSASAPP